MTTLFAAFPRRWERSVGSFLNACIHRMPRGSACRIRSAPSVHPATKLIPWYENIPVS